jgi:hypothetical protein
MTDSTISKTVLTSSVDHEETTISLCQCRFHPHISTLDANSIEDRKPTIKNSSVEHVETTTQSQSGFIPTSGTPFTVVGQPTFRQCHEIYKR